MPIRRESFPTDGATPAVEVRNPAGTVTVTAVEGLDALTVDVDPLNGSAEQLVDQVSVELLRGPARLVVAVPTVRLLSSPRFAVTITVPAGCPVTTVVASADCTLRGPLAEVEVTGASSDVRVESCTGLQVRVASGDLHAVAVHGDVGVRSASGDVRLDDVAGSLTVSTASGDVRLGAVGGDVEVSTASADVTVGRVTSGEVALRTVSGDATVAVAPGLRLWLDLQSISGRLDSQLAGDDDAGGEATLVVRMHSVSGNLRLRRAG